MSKTIDQRVVEMRFDNKNFERNVSETMSTLEKFKQKLNLSGATKGLENVDSAAKKVDMSGLGSAVETVRTKFSAMEVMAVTALANITNSAVNAGKRIVSALTIDPIKTGFSEYETKINAIQTIMSNTASKGTTMDDVTRVIGELNTYADKTIYNFAEMTRNIGTFTAAGIGLEESAKAIQGIANLAAASGSNSQQASTAMYQLSQALSTGTVRLMDWNSVVNAGMGGEKFQEALKATAREYGVEVDDIIEANGSFRDSLQDGWLTADILNETLRKFTVDGAKAYAKSMVESGKYTQEQADALIKEAQAMEDAATKVKTFTQLWDTLKESAQSGWSQTWEIIVGDFEEAKETLTKFSDVIGGMIGASADARNELLQGWKDAGGRADLIDSLYNVFEGVLSIVKPIKEAFREIFPPTTVAQLVKFTEGLKNFTAKLKISDETSDKLKRTFKGLFAIVGIVVDIFKSVGKAVGSLFGTMGGLGSGILDVTANIGDWLVKLRESIQNSEVLDKALKGVVAVIKFVVSGIKKMLSMFTGVGEFFTSLANGVTSSIDSMGAALEQCTLVKILKGIWTVVKTLVSGILKGLGAIFDGLVDRLGGGNGLEGVVDLINGLISGGIGIAIMKLINSWGDSFGGLKDIVEGISDIFGGLGGVLEGYQNKLNAEALTKIAIAIGILAASLLVVSLIDKEKLYDAIVGIAALFAALVGSMAILSKSTGVFRGAFKMSSMMMSMAISVLILASALKVVGSLETDEMATGMLGIAGLVAIMVVAMKSLASVDGKTMVKGATQMVIFAASIKILASACADLAWLSWDELAKGLLGVGTLLGLVSVFISNTQFKGKAVSSATGVVLIAAALKILASACEDFGQMEWGDIAKGLTAIAILVAGIIQFTRMTSGASNLASIGVGLIAIAAAMKIFASATTDLGKLSWDELARGLIGMAGAMMMVITALGYLPKNMTSQGIGLLAIATAMLVLAAAMNKMGGMSWTEIAKGLLAMGAAMAILAVGLKAMTGTISGSAAMIVAALALGMLTPVLLILGAMSWSSIAKGLIVLAGAFAAIGIAGYLLAPIMPAILGLAGALALIGVSVLAVGAGLLAAGLGLSAIAAGLAALVGSLAASIKIIVELVTAVIVGICEGIAEGIIAICKIITNGAPAIFEAVTVLILGLCDVLVDCAPPIVRTILELVVKLLDALIEFTPQIVDALFRFVIGVLESLAKNIPTFIKKLLEILGSIFKGVVDALKSMDPDMLADLILSVGLLTAIAFALAALSAVIPAALAGAAGLGVLAAELAIVLAAIGASAQIPGLDWLINKGGDLLEGIGRAIGKFIGGLVGGIAEGITSSLPDIATDLSEFMINLQPFIDGAKQIDSSVLEGVKSIAGVILALTGASILDGLTSWITGGSSLSKFGEDLASFGPNMKAYADSISGVDSSVVTASADAARALAEMASIVPNEGGMVAWFTGDNSIAKFGEELVELGKGLKGFSDNVVGVVPENIIAAANAAKALAEMANTIPNTGGMVSWFTGDNSVAKFGEELVELGKGLKGFSDEVTDVAPENIVAAANAAKALAEMTSILPNEGGMVAWFTGDNSVSKFAFNIKELGKGLKGFSDATVDLVPANVTAAANAAKALAEMTAYIPTTGGMVAWFAGDASVSKFGEDLPALGSGLKGFSDAVTGIVPENVSAAANAAKTLAEMTATIPNTGGMVVWFAGDASVSKFSKDLPALGSGLKGFSDAVTGIVPENVTAAANAAKSLAEMTAHIPNEGGMKAWFTGEKSMSKFSLDIITLGAGLKGFSDNVTGIVPENVVAAANAAKALAEMANTVPTEGGMKAWFTGEKSVANFGGKLPELGKGLKGFSDAVKGIVPENVTAAANAAKSLSEMVNSVPKDTSKLTSFGTNVVSFGGSLKSYFEKTGGINDASVSATKNAINAIKEAASIDSGGIKSTAKAIDELIKSIKKLPSITTGTAQEFNRTLKEMGKSGAEGLLKAFKDIEPKMKKAGEDAINAFIKGAEGKSSSMKKACKKMASDCADAMSDRSKDWKSAGKACAEGFANGISANAYLAKAKAKAMAKAALKAAEEALGIASPSKEFYKDGSFAGQGFVNALSDFASKSYRAGGEMAISAKNGLQEVISGIGDVIGGEFDTEPTIRPVLDLSDVRSGVNAMGSMLSGKSSVGVMANVGTISSMMNRRNQNGVNAEVVSAIDKLRKDLGNIGGTTYNVNGITYDDGSNMSEAVKSMVRAAKIERRV